MWSGLGRYTDLIRSFLRGFPETLDSKDLCSWNLVSGNGCMLYPSELISRVHPGMERYTGVQKGTCVYMVVFHNEH